MIFSLNCFLSLRESAGTAGRKFLKMCIIVQIFTCERFAQEALGHNSKAVHRAYSALSK